MTYSEIQCDVIKRFGITVVENSTCRGRMHAHVKERKVCKWKPSESYANTFSLFHEIGHIQTHTQKMRRAESEYYATVWAIDRLNEYGLPIKLQQIFIYQRYILLEIRRGERRGGADYGDLNLYKYIGKDVTLDDVYNTCNRKWQRFIDGDYYSII